MPGCFKLDILQTSSGPSTTRQQHWKKLGRNSNFKDELEAALQGARASLARGFLSEDAVAEALQAQGSTADSGSDIDLDDGECVTAYVVQLIRREACHGIERECFLVADSLERLQLLQLDCWRPIEDTDDVKGLPVVSSAVVYTKKRCGKCKARFVAFGCVMTPESKALAFSPTVSHMATRVFCVSSASEGKFLGQCDISNAFIRSTLDPSETVLLRLPKHWSESPRGDLVLLLRFLYGLRIAPRNWFETLSEWLTSAGFRMNEMEPGLFQRGSIRLVVYVDDILVSDDSQSKVDSVIQEILTKFSGKVIPAEVKGNTEIRDILGVRLTYSRVERSCSFDLEQAIIRICERFKIEAGCPISAPVVYSDLTEGQEDSSFPLRSLIGSLQYVASLCRPD